MKGFHKISPLCGGRKLTHFNVRCLPRYVHIYIYIWIITTVETSNVTLKFPLLTDERVDSCGEQKGGTSKFLNVANDKPQPKQI